MVPQVIKDTLPDSKEAWRWGIGGFLAVTLISFFMVQMNADKAYFRTEYLGTVKNGEVSKEKLADVLDKLGDNIATSTEVQRQQLKKAEEQTKELDDIGDAQRAQNKLFDKFLITLEREQVFEESDQ
jgi:hypothetical protein